MRGGDFSFSCHVSPVHAGWKWGWAEGGKGGLRERSEGTSECYRPPAWTSPGLGGARLSPLLHLRANLLTSLSVWQGRGAPRLRVQRKLLRVPCATSHAHVLGADEELLGAAQSQRSDGPRVSRRRRRWPGGKFSVSPRSERAPGWLRQPGEGSCRVKNPQSSRLCNCSVGFGKVFAITQPRSACHRIWLPSSFPLITGPRFCKARGEGGCFSSVLAFHLSCLLPQGPGSGHSSVLGPGFPAGPCSPGSPGCVLG